MVRTLSGLDVRARRAVCPACGGVHLLEPASTLPRMRDSAGVVGAAWQAKGRRGRPPQHRGQARPAGALRAAATDWLYQFGPSAPPLEPVGRAVAAASSRLGPRAAVAPWPTAVSLTGGLVASWGPTGRLLRALWNGTRPCQVRIN